MSGYHGSEQRIRSGGGAVRVTLASNVGQGNGGTSIPCAGCFVQALAGNTALVRMNIGTDASATVGIDLGRPYVYDGTEEASQGCCQPLWVPVDDVALLYFYSTQANAVVDILYLHG
jgi:hypothetical protein